MSEMCYFLHDDIDMGAHIYTCGHQKEMTWGECPCKDGISCDFFVSKSEVDKLVRQYVNNREETERKKGEWIHKPDIYLDEQTWECSECGEPWIFIEGTPSENNANYCPNCGADMR